MNLVFLLFVVIVLFVVVIIFLVVVAVVVVLNRGTSRHRWMSMSDAPPPRRLDSPLRRLHFHWLPHDLRPHCRRMFCASWI